MAQSAVATSPQPSAAADAHSRTRALTSACLVLFLAFGIFLRSWGFHRSYSLNHDEAALALNLTHRTTWQLRGPLDFRFLLVEHAVVRLVGSSESALRIFPLLCSIASLVLFWNLVRLRSGHFGLVAQIAAVGFLALSQDLIAFSPRVKQYSTELLVAVVLLIICDRLLQQSPSRRLLLFSVLAGALAPWFSFSAAFVEAGIGLACLAYGVRHTELLKKYAGVFCVWGISLIAALWTTLRFNGEKDALKAFWAANFLPWNHPTQIAPWLIEALRGLGASATSVRLGTFAAAALVMGIIVAWRARNYFRTALVVSIASCLFASALKQYPFTNRFVFFLVPATLILIFEPLANLRPAGIRQLLTVVCFLALMYSAFSAVKNRVLATPGLEDDPRDLFAEIHREWQPGDTLYLSGAATPSFLYYRSALGFGDHDAVSQRRPESLQLPPRFMTFTIRPGRAWFVYFPINEDGFDRYAVAHATQHARLLRQIGRKLYVASLWQIE